LKNLSFIILIFSSLIFSNEIKGQDEMINIGLAFPGRRVGGGTRGECSARKIMHLVPESNIAFQNDLGHFALIIGPSNDPKDININFKEFEETKKNKINLNNFKIKASKEKVFLISIPSQDAPFILESSFDCNDNTDMGYDFNFIQDSSPPAQTLIAPSSYQKNKNHEDKMAWLSKFCDKNISQSSLSEKFQIGELFDENWAKDINVICLNKLS
jgi:hypothetical protein